MPLQSPPLRVRAVQPSLTLIADTAAIVTVVTVTIVDGRVEERRHHSP
jgi:hypothetical protein